METSYIKIVIREHEFNKFSTHNINEPWVMFKFYDYIKSKQIPNVLENDKIESIIGTYKIKFDNYRFIIESDKSDGMNNLMFITFKDQLINLIKDRIKHSYKIVSEHNKYCLEEYRHEKFVNQRSASDSSRF